MIEKELVMPTYGEQNYNLHGIIWMPDETPVQKVIHVVHGMTEHIGRYRQFAETMTKNGIAVAGFDLRGHGKNAGDPVCASFAYGETADASDYGWYRSLEDIKRQKIEIRMHCPEAKYYLMGFSLGSFLVRDYMNEIPMNKIDGIILMGTGHQPPIITNTMKAIAHIEIGRAEPHGTTETIRKLAFDTYNKKFEPRRTMFDWLCSDEKARYEYIDDPLLRKDIAADLFYEMMACMSRVNRISTYNGENDLSTTPILLMSGENDAVSDMGKSIKTIARQMERAGLTNVTTEIIPGARHDILHEYESGAAGYATNFIKEWLGN